MSGKRKEDLCPNMVKSNQYGHWLRAESKKKRMIGLQREHIRKEKGEQRGNFILHNTNKKINKGWGDEGEDGGRGERGTGIETAITQLREDKESMRLDPSKKEEDLENIHEIHSNL